MKKYIYIGIIVLAGAGLLVACGGGGSKSNPEASPITPTNTSSGNDTTSNNSSSNTQTVNSTSSSTSTSQSNSQSLVINGITVPPDPGEAGKETLAGIDSNNNGVRDDVERVIAEDYGDNESFLPIAIGHATLLQNLFINDNIQQRNELPSNRESKSENITVFINKVKCASSQELKIFDLLERKYINTSERALEFSKMLGGRSGGGSCE